MKKVLVTGANGQLGQCIKELSNNLSEIGFIFKGSSVLDITNLTSIKNTFDSETFDYCINCAAYTAVDKAEEEIELAVKVNKEGAKNIANFCSKYDVTLIHVSTDFVFDGKTNMPYNEEGITNPLSVYGQTKLDGENEIKSILKKYFIIRTSWLYSEYGNNFLKTMLRLSKEKDLLTIINDQIGTPTYAKDLAKIIISIILSENNNYGLYHFSNQGVASWYDFTKAIFEYKNINIEVRPISTSSYKTLAIRPQFSVLNKEKIEQMFNITILYWKDSLKDCLYKIK